MEPEPTDDASAADLTANAERFTGFADLYDSVRPTPPTALATILASYAGGDRPGRVVDLGSGTGLSSRWASAWADSVTGVEPSSDMRVEAERSTNGGTVAYVRGWSHATGLPDHCADVALAVQALHWMDPVPTFAEIARVLRPGGVFAAIDCDWPPSVGNAKAEGAWQRARATIKRYEERLARGLSDDELRAPFDTADDPLPAYFGRDPNQGRTMAVGVKAWSKDQHLANMQQSGSFAWCGEIAMIGEEVGSADRFIGLLRSQGDFQTLRKHGLSEAQLGVSACEEAVRDALGGGERPMWFTFRVRIGVTAQRPK